MQQIGVGHKGLFERQDDLSSVAYWYQKEPHNVFSKLPEKEKDGQDRKGSRKVN